MAKKKKQSNKDGIVYSTNPDFSLEPDEQPVETPLPGEQRLKVGRESKGRGGKVVTLVRGFEGAEDDLKDLGKLVKSRCGTGGSVKDGEIVIQGDRRQDVADVLRKEGYKVTVV